VHAFSGQDCVPVSFWKHSVVAAVKLKLIT